MLSSLGLSCARYDALGWMVLSDGLALASFGILLFRSFNSNDALIVPIFTLPVSRLVLRTLGLGNETLSTNLPRPI